MIHEMKEDCYTKIPPLREPVADTAGPATAASFQERPRGGPQDVGSAAVDRFAREVQEPGNRPVGIAFDFRGRKHGPCRDPVRSDPLEEHAVLLVREFQDRFRDFGAPFRRKTDRRGNERANPFLHDRHQGRRLRERTVRFGQADRKLERGLHGIGVRQGRFQTAPADPREDQIDDRNVRFAGGCPGNTAAIGKLLEGADAKSTMDLLRGTDCGGKGTSCADQLSRGIEKALAEGTVVA